MDFVLLLWSLFFSIDAVVKIACNVCCVAFIGGSYCKGDNYFLVNHIGVLRQNFKSYIKEENARKIGYIFKK